jgi:hypothetical protein
MREKAQRGTSENGLPVFMIRTDGLKWQFGMLSKRNDNQVAENLLSDFN